MPTLIVENIPADVIEGLQKRAALEKRSVPDELVLLLQQALRSVPAPSPRWPDYVASDEVSAPCDLPRSSQPVMVKAVPGEPRLPDPVVVVVSE